VIPPPTLIIGGTAAYGLDLAAYHPLGQAEVIATPYGASPPITFLQPDAGSPPVAFCSRHGHDRLQRSAAFVNHRATIWAAKMLGVQAIFSWNGTGAIAHHLEVGDLVIPHDFLDFSRTRIATFGEADLPPASGPAFHPAARAALLAAAESLAPASVHSAGVYVCTEGPRLETAREIQRLERDGCDLVGMTGMPEAALARELGLCYACCALVANWAAGKEAAILSMTEIEQTLRLGMTQVLRLIPALLDQF